MLKNIIRVLPGLGVVGSFFTVIKFLKIMAIEKIIGENILGAEGWNADHLLWNYI